MSNSNDLFDVTIVPSRAGPAPLPPADLREVFAAFDAIQAGPRDSLQTDLGAALRLVAAVFVGHYAPQAPGLSAKEMALWADEIRATLSGRQRAQLFAYLEMCSYWEHALCEAIEWGEADWEEESPHYVRPSEAELTVADHLRAAGIPVQTHASVVQDQVRRRLGDRYGALWLRWAHRDRSYLLRIAIELDGQYFHIFEADQEFDQERDKMLADRGWYVAKLSGSNREEGIRRLAWELLPALVKQHRRAIVLARSDLPALMRNLP